MKPTKHHRPLDRLTRITDAGLAGAKAAPEYRSTDRVIVLIYEDEGNAGIGMAGYHGDTVKASSDLFNHLSAIFETNGLHVSFVPLEQKGQG